MSSEVEWLYRRLWNCFRGRRKVLFHRWLRPSPGDRILDVGGRPEFWLRMECEASVTCLNLVVPEGEYDRKRATCVQGDGRSLPFGDQSFDIVFSNSVIQYAGDFAAQRRFADEVGRVGKAYWVQTPNRWFFVEPDLMTPFIHYLPKATQKRLVRWGTVRGWLARPSPQGVAELIESSRLLTRAEMRRLFPDGYLYEERFLFATKSFVAYKPKLDLVAARG